MSGSIACVFRGMRGLAVSYGARPHRELCATAMARALMVPLAPGSACVSEHDPKYLRTYTNANAITNVIQGSQMPPLFNPFDILNIQQLVMSGGDPDWYRVDCSRRCLATECLLGVVSNPMPHPRCTTEGNCGCQSNATGMWAGAQCNRCAAGYCPGVACSVMYQCRSGPLFSIV